MNYVFLFCTSFNIIDMQLYLKVRDILYVIMCFITLMIIEEPPYRNENRKYRWNPSM